jgi:threonine dehydrogenase-like Zn-dependent dehydrogenase
MRAVRSGRDGIEVVDVAPPDGDGVRLRVKAAGICASDLNLVRSGPVAHTLGHEISGVLDDGTPVAVEPILPCGTCARCRAGDYHLCDRAAPTLIGVGTDGGMADEVLVANRCLVPLPSGVPVQDACLVEPLAVAVHGLRVAGLTGGERVGVVGSGTIGLCAVVAATALGCEVGLAARHLHQLAAGEQLGANSLSGHYDLVVEAAGTASALEQSAALARPGSTVLVLGVFWDKIPVPGLQAMTKELRVLPTICYNRHAGGRDIDAAASLLAARPEVGEVMITHRFPLEDAATAFQVAADRAAGAIKVVLEP